MEEEKIKYKAFSFRLHDGTYEIMKEIKKESGKSWNRLFYDMAIFYKNNSKLKDKFKK